MYLEESELVDKVYEIMRNDEFQSFVEEIVLEKMEEYKKLWESRQQKPIIPVLDRESWYNEDNDRVKPVETIDERSLKRCPTEDIDTTLISRVKDMCRALKEHHGLKAITMEIFTEDQLYLITDPQLETGMVDTYMRNGISPALKTSDPDTPGCRPQTDPTQPGDCSPVLTGSVRLVRRR